MRPEKNWAAPLREPMWKEEALAMVALRVLMVVVVAT